MEAKNCNDIHVNYFTNTFFYTPHLFVSTLWGLPLDFSDFFVFLFLSFACWLSTLLASRAPFSVSQFIICNANGLCFIFFNARLSICLMRSRVTCNTFPTSSKVYGSLFSSRPKRRQTISLSFADKQVNRFSVICFLTTSSSLSCDV